MQIFELKQQFLFELQFVCFRKDFSKRWNLTATRKPKICNLSQSQVTDRLVANGLSKCQTI